MKIQADKIIARINRLSLRERLILLLSLNFSIIYIWYSLLGGPVLSEVGALNDKISREQNKTTELANKMTSMISRLSQDPNIAVRADIERLNAEQVIARTRLLEIASDLISPEHMAQVLEDLLRSNRRLRLLTLQNLDKVDIPIGAHESDQSGTTPHIYKHSLILHLEGGYNDTLAYLKQLETMPWQVYWEAFQLDVKRHPKSRVVIELYTLSLNEEWIGV